MGPVGGDALQGLLGLAPPLRVGLCTQAFSGSTVDPENAAAAEHCASLLEGLGCGVEISSPSPLSDPAFWKAAAALLAVNLAVEVDTWSAKLGRQLGGAGHRA